ncbi:MAG: TonB-dependent receptor plug domain-containing protein [Oceanobacter sp.]
MKTDTQNSALSLSALPLATAGLMLCPVAVMAEELAVDAEPNSYENVEEVVIYGQRETPTEIQARKLVKVAGAGNDPIRAISSMPGVTFASADGASVPAVRGSSPYENLYLVDDMPVGYVFHTDSNSIISDNTLKDFKLETAGFGPEYDNASAAVIDVTSRDPYETEQLVVDLSLLRVGLFAETGDEDSGGFFSARESLFQYYLKEVMQDDDLELTMVPEYYDYQGKYQWRLANDNITVQALGSRDKAGLTFSDDSDEVERDPELSGGIEFYQQFHAQGLFWDHWYESGATHRIGLYSLQQDYRFSIGDNNDVDINFVDTGLRSRFEQPLGLDHTLGFGLHYVWRDVNNQGQLTVPPCDEFQPDCRFSDSDETLTINDVERIQNWDAHLEDEWAVTEDVTLNAGVLASWDDYTDQRFMEPKLRADWQVNADWRVAGSYGRYHKMSEQFFYYSRSMGNPELKQPQATHYELELERELGNGLSAQLDLYYKDMDKLITSRLDASEYDQLSEEEYLELPKFTNDAEGHAWGAELFINKNITERWYGWMSLAYARTFRHHKLTDESFRYQYDQPLILNLVASWQGDVWEYGVKWRMQSGQLYTPVTGASYDADMGAYQPYYGDLNSERLPMQQTLDLRAEREVESWGIPMDIYFEAINVLGSSNVQGYEYSGDYQSREEVKGLPMLISFGAKMHFL